MISGHLKPWIEDRTEELGAEMITFSIEGDSHPMHISLQAHNWFQHDIFKLFDYFSQSSELMIMANSWNHMENQL